MKPTIDYTLYLVTDRRLMSTPTLEECVQQACEGGVTVVQLREKRAAHNEFLELAKGVKAVCDSFGVPLIVNDEPEIAVEVGAAGVHVGQGDMPIERVRDIVGPDCIIGVSASTPAEAFDACARGADYLGIGAMYFTPTKPEAHVTTMEELDEIMAQVKIPAVVIGGINEKSIPRFKGKGLAGYSVVSAIVAAPDVRTAAQRLRAVIDE